MEKGLLGIKEKKTIRRSRRRERKPNSTGAKRKEGYAVPQRKKPYRSQVGKKKRCPDAKKKKRGFMGGGLPKKNREGGEKKKAAERSEGGNTISESPWKKEKGPVNFNAKRQLYQKGKGVSSRHSLNTTRPGKQKKGRTASFRKVPVVKPGGKKKQKKHSMPERKGHSS